MKALGQAGTIFFALWGLDHQWGRRQQNVRVIWVPPFDGAPRKGLLTQGGRV